MKDNIPEGMLGYVIASLPDAGHWQGFYVLDAYRGQGEALLRQVVEANRTASAHSGPTEVESALADTDKADQATIGALSAVLIEFFSLGTAVPQPAGAQVQRIMNGVAAAAWRSGRSPERSGSWSPGGAIPQGRPGFATTVRHYDVESLDEAREAMAADIDRSKRGRKLVEEMMGGLRDLGQRKRGG